MARDSENRDTAQIKILEGGKKARRILAFLHRPYNDPEEMEDYLATIAPESDVISVWQTLIDNIKTKGITALFQSKSRLLQQFGIDQTVMDSVTDVNDKEPWLIPLIKDAYKSTFREQWVKQVNSWDPLSRIGTVAELGDSEFANSWIFDGNPLTQWAYAKGNNGVVHGRVKRGKTDFSLRLTEYFLKENWIVVSNIRVKNPHPDYHYTPTLTEMLREICKARLANRKVLILMDEGAIFWIKIDTIQAQNKALAKIILTLGKLDSTLLYIGHREKDLPDIVVWSAVAYFEKLGIKKVSMQIDEGLIIRSSTYLDVPRTSFEFDPGEIQNFDVDLVVEDLFKYMSRLPEGANQWEAMTKYLDEHGGELKDENETVKRKTVARFLKEQNPELSIREIAELTRSSSTTIHRYISEGGTNK